jgi:iron complex outermembrane receptor protein
MLNTEFGVKGNKSNLIFGLNFFHMYYRDQLILTGSINDVGAPVRRNVPTSYRMGIEMTGRWEPNPVFNLEGNATISRNKIRNFIEYIDDWDNGGQISIEHGKTDIAFSPKTVAFARTNVNLLKNRLLTVSLSGKYVGEQFIDNTSNRNTMLDAYFTSEFQVRYILKPYFLEEISLNLLINNLLDTRYSSNAWTYRYVSSVYDGRPYDPYTRWEGGNVYNLTGFFPQAGRHFLAGVTVNF